jgi:hypothetical protein
LLPGAIVVPEVKAAAALVQHHPEEVAGFVLSSVSSYVLVSKAPHLQGGASLGLKKPQQAVTDFEPGIRYRQLAIGEGGNGAALAPDYGYGLCLLGNTAQAQSDRAAATRSYAPCCSTSGKMLTRISFPPQKPGASWRR